MKAGRLLLGTLMLVSLFSVSAFSQTLTVTVVNDCGGPPPNGQIIATVSGGISPYTYVYSQGGIPIATNPSTEPSDTLSGLPAGTYEVDVTDGGANMMNETVTIASDPDNTPPTQTCALSQLIGDGVECYAILPNFLDSTSVSDNCDPNPSRQQTPPPGDTIFANTVITLIAEDASGNVDSCQFTVGVLDTVPPAFECAPDTVFLTADNDCMSFVPDFIDTLVTSDCNPIISKQQFPPAGDLIGHNEPVTIVVSDPAGNADSCTFIISLIDNTPPSMTCPGSRSVNANADCEAVLADYRGDANVNDNCDPNPTVTQSPPPGTVISSTTVVTITATDESGNTNNCSFAVGIRDRTAPVISCPGPQEIIGDTLCLAPLPNYTVDVGVFDNCTDTSDLAVLQFPFAGTLVQGLNFVQIVVIDASGNSSVCGIQVQVRDTLPPTIDCPADDILITDQNCEVVLPDYRGAATADDNCDPPSLTQSPAPGTVLSGVGTVQTITIIATDASGNSDSCSFEVTLEDTLPPAPLVCPSDTVLANDPGTCEAVFTFSAPTVTDNCTGVTTVTQIEGPASGSAFPIGTTTVTFVAADSLGNSDTCSFTVTVEDTGAPAFVDCPSDTTIFADAANCGATFTFATPVASDQCSGAADSTVTVTQTSGPASGDVFPVGDTRVVFTATDSVGNTDSCVFIVTVRDTIAPIANCTDTTVYVDQFSIGTLTPAILAGGSTDNCGPITFSTVPPVVTCNNVGNTVAVTVTVFDLDSNSASCVSQVTVLDTIAPTVTCEDTTIYLDASGEASVSAADLVQSSSDNCSVTGFTLSQSTFTCADEGTNSITLTATDGSGNTGTCVTQITVMDTISPTVVCRDTVIHLDGSGTATITPSDVDGGSFDNCSFTATVTPSTFTTADVGPNSVTLVITDTNGNMDSCTAIVTIVDPSVPTVFCRDTTISLGTGGTATLIPSDLIDPSSDTVGVAGISISQTLFDCSDIGSNSVVLYFIKLNGDLDSCTATVIVEDNTAPTVVCQDFTVELDASGNATLSASDIDNGSTDNCGIASMTVSDSIFTCADAGTHTVTLVVTDNSGNMDSCTATVTVEDNISPTVVCQDITVQLDASGNAVVSAADVDNGSSDNCSMVTMVLDDSTFNCSDIGTNTVTLTVTDASGNSSSCSATVTIEDITSPTVVCQDFTVQLNASGNATISVANIDNGSTDNCGIASRTLSQTAFTCADIGTNTVTLYVTDNSGNIDSCTSTVTVEDNISPNAICQNVTVQLDASGNASIVPSDINNGSTDNCGNLSMVLSDSIFSCANLGPNAVTLTVTDAGGNSDVCSAIVTVQDNIAPTAICQNITVYLNPSGNATIAAADVDNGSTDNCAIVSRTLSQTNFTCADVGPNPVILSVVDASGNSDFCTATVTVLDTLAPTVSCQDVTVQLNASGNAVVTAASIDNGSSDNCGGPVTRSLSQSTFTCADIGPNTVTLTVTDASGNVDSCTAIVTVEDNQSPTAICQNITVQLDASGNANITASDIDNGSTDNCGIADMVLNDSIFTCADLGPNVVVLTVTDTDGNTSNCSAIVTVVDNIAPTAICQNITVQLNASGNATITAADVDNGSTDNCSITSMSLSKTLFTCADAGANTVTLTVTDANGNTDNCTAIVTVQENVNPIAVCRNITIPLDATGNATITASDIDDGSTDNCGIVSRTISQTNFTCADVGANTVTLTVTDGSGNTATCNATVTVVENIAPTAVCQNITLQLGASGTVSITGSDIDNGSTDNCAIVSTTLSQTTFSCNDVGVNTVVMTVTDASGNSTNCTAVVTVEDQVAPVVTCPSNVTVNAAPGSCDAFVNIAIPTATDNCGVATLTNSFTGTNDASGTYPIGTTTVTYTATDGSGNATTCSFDVTVNFDEPFIAISDSTIEENQPAMTMIGNLSLQPSDPNTVFTLVGTGNDNARFVLQGNTLYSNQSFDFESQSTYTIRVQATVCGGSGTVTRDITIIILDVNDPPASITLSNNTINENAPVGTTIGIFNTIDQDPTDTHVYTIMAGNTDNDLTIVNDELRVNNPLDYETKPTYTILVRSTDPGGLFVEETFVIFVEVDPTLPLDIPTAFTPDGDGVNDTWNIDNIGVHPAAVVQVYDRWGKRVFNQRGYNHLNEWDGRYDGDMLPAGTYFYVVDVNDGRDPLTGTVTLIY